MTMQPFNSHYRPGGTCFLRPGPYPAGGLTLPGRLATTAVMAGEDKTLDGLRARIDDCDRQIVALLNERAKIVVDIGKIKQASGEPVYSPDREKAVLARVRKLTPGPLP